MNPAQELPLRDIHLPDPVSWWPPAPGWWLLAVLMLLLIAGLYWLLKKIRQPVLKKSAREEIRYIIDAYQQHQQKLLLIQQLSMAIRRIAMSYVSRQQMAGLTGAHWYHKLNAEIGGQPLGQQAIELLLEMPYQKTPDISDEQVELLIDEVQGWVSGLDRNKKHV